MQFATYTCNILHCLCMRRGRDDTWYLSTLKASFFMIGNKAVLSYTVRNNISIKNYITFYIFFLTDTFFCLWETTENIA